MKPGQSCATCAHFAALPKECRAKSPVAMLVLDQHQRPATMGVFPPTKPENWCGEHKESSE